MGDIVARGKALLLQPAQVWPAIAAESTDTKSLILGYAVIVSSIPAVIGLMVPVAGLLVVLLGLAYSIYLFYLGAPLVAKVPADKAVPFTVAVSICAILLSVVIGLLTARLFLG